MADAANGVKNPGPEASSPERAAGAALALSGALFVVAMGHHPTGVEHARELGRFVHGALIALSVVAAAGFFRFSAQRGFERFPIALAFAFYVAGMIANLLAGSINGFVVPALLERQAYEADAALLWTLNQTFAKSAVYAIGVAFALWGADLFVRGPGFSSKLLGVAGLAAGLPGAAMLATGVLDMHVAGAFAIYSGHAAFTVLAGLYLATARNA